MSYFWLFEYTKLYYLLHPWKFITTLVRNIRWAHQRAMRGWDDAQPAMLPWVLCNILPPMLDKLVEDNVIDWDAALELNEGGWEELVGEVKEGFLAGQDLLGARYVSSDEYGELKDKLELGLYLFYRNFLNLDGW